MTLVSRVGFGRGSNDLRPKQDRRLEGPVELFAAFDHDADKLRFDRTEVVWPAHAGEDPTRAPNGMPLLTGKWIKTPERSVVWRSIKAKHSRSTVVVYPASVKPPSDVNPFDIRIVGICNVMGYLKNTQMPKIVDGYTKSASNGKVSRVDGTTVRLEWKDEFLRTIIDFDEKMGYLPTRYEERWLRHPPGESNDPIETSTVRWTRVNGIWVPVHLLQVSGTKPGPVDSYDLTFEWESVNKPVPAELFMTRGMGLPDGTLIAADAGEPKGGPMASLGKVGDLEPDPRLVDLEADAATPTPWWVWTLVGLLAASLIGGGGYLVYRRRTNPRSGESPSVGARP
jgi:hypothetical protein